MITYQPFWETLKKKNISQYQLIKQYHVSAGQLSRIRSGSYISTHTIEVLCTILDCKVEEIIQFVKQKDEKFM